MEPTHNQPKRILILKPINVTVVGAGTMGHSLALAFIQHGHTVWLQDIGEEIYPCAGN